jgi:hypothetical protein
MSVTLAGTRARSPAATAPLSGQVNVVSPALTDGGAGARCKVGARPRVRRVIAPGPAAGAALRRAELSLTSVPSARATLHTATALPSPSPPIH